MNRIFIYLLNSVNKWVENEKCIEFSQNQNPIIIKLKLPFSFLSQNSTSLNDLPDLEYLSSESQPSLLPGFGKCPANYLSEFRKVCSFLTICCLCQPDILFSFFSISPSRFFSSDRWKGILVCDRSFITFFPFF